ncbi:MAG: hypothetical protein Q9185_006352 [Variospora sp. 1 TL-2023]
MHVVNPLIVLMYLFFITSPLYAVPLMISSQPASLRSLRTQHHQQQYRPRAFTPPHAVIHFNTLTHHTRFVQLYAFYPVTKAIIRALGSLYFEVFFNLSPHGPWANIPPMSHVVLHAGGLYLEFLSSDPRLPVPWSVVRDWAEALDMDLNMGGFIGEYIASFKRLTGDGDIEYWIRLGTAPPPPLAAAGAKRKRLKE